MKKNIFFQKLLCTLVLFGIGPMLFAARNIINGTVSDENGEPLMGAAVIVRENNTAVPGANAITDVDGKFTVEAYPGQQLFVSFLGYTDRYVTVGSNVNYIIVLESDNVLDDVVVVGYGSQKKVNLTGAVSSIDSDVFDRRQVVSASVALQGAAPGVTVTTYSGAPGNDSGSIRIRGVNSFGGSSTSPLILIDGIEGSLDSIDPATIESISVLKDAASASIYGSRAANGVVLVTTKRGSKDPFTLSYKGYVGWSTPTDLPDVVNAIQYKELTNLMNINDGVDPTYDEETMNLWYQYVGTDDDLYPDTDWQDAVLNGSGFMHNHSLSLGAATEKVSTRTTFGYTEQNGIIKNTDYTRYNFRNNADIFFNDKLSMKLDVALSYGIRNYSPYQGTIFNYMNTRPADITNQFSTGLYNGLGLMGSNPVALMLYGGQYTTQNLNLTGGVTLTYKPFEWLSFQGMFQPRYNTVNRHNYKKSVTTYQDAEGTSTLTNTPYDSLTESASRSFYNNSNFLITLQHNFNGHDLKLTLGEEYNSYDYRYLSAYRQVFNYDYDQIDAGEITDMDNSGYEYEWATQSFFGRINYSFKDRYLLEANIRADGSSRFTKSNRWGYFPSVSGAWRISEEPFFANAKKSVGLLKIRASYGSLGNQELAGSGAASYYPTSQNLATNSISMNGNIYSIVTLTTLANEDLSWETTKVFDIGFDMTLFKNLSITADWYDKHTDDILMTLDIASAIGLNAPYQNAGSVRNRGWEVSVSYNNQWGNFYFGTTLNLSDVKNEITDMKGKTATDGVLRNQEGSSIASIYALDCLGIIRTQEEADWVNENCPQFGETVYIGDLRYKDVNEDGVIDDTDKTIVGSTIPRYTYSANFDFGWKNLTLSVMLQGVGKADGYLNTYYSMPSRMGGTFRSEYLDSTNADNPNGSTPRLTSTCTNNWKDSSYWMRSAAYLRVKNIQLTYNLPQKWMKAVGIAGASVFVNAQNLFTFTNFYDGYDPEVGYGGSSSSGFDVVSLETASNYPQVKTYTAGVTINF